MAKKSALVMSGGGARGAYQAGCVRGLYEICEELGDFSIFRTLCGVSAGSINAYHLAAGTHKLDQSTQLLCNTWRKLTAEQVFRTDYSSITRNAFKLMRTLSLSGFSSRQAGRIVALLNTNPLRELISAGGGTAGIRKNLQNGVLEALSVTATDYSTSFSVSFVHTAQAFKDWASDNRVSVQTEISDEHIMASSAIPVFFPPALISGRYYGDGSLRNSAPLSPAIHLGAEKVFVIGVRNWANVSLESSRKLHPSLGRIVSVLINSIFVDSIESDLERVQLINQSVEAIKNANGNTSLRPIETFYVHPSQDPAELAMERADDLPKIIKFLFEGLGTPEESAELLSYFLFDSTYCAQLVELGRKDTLDQKERIVQFLISD
ncbi:MAG: patatin-like phospholipase family protein [Bdellovibrionales bacterium]|nr:patatin-like phospholipase family protein [Bdellovibrionales bacterium]